MRDLPLFKLNKNMAVRYAGILALAAIFLLIIFLAVFQPGKNSFYPVCLFHQLTGLHCPGCGTARAMHALLNGNVLLVLRMNLLTLLFMPILIYTIIRLFIFATTGKWRCELDLGAKWGKVLLWIIVLFWISRNIPFFPFTLLAPY